MFPPERLARIMSAQVVRRVEHSNITSYSQTFDTITRSVGGIVPGILNLAQTALPFNGFGSSKKERYTVEVTSPDRGQVEDYLNSGQFQTDLNDLRQFGVANSIGLVPFETRMGSNPSVTARIRSDKQGIQTLPKGIFHRQEMINIPKEVEVETVIQKDKGQKSLAKVQVPSVPVSDKELVSFLEKYPTVTFTRQEVTSDAFSEELSTQFDISYHSVKMEPNFDTPNEAASVLFPLFIYSDDIFASDEMDIHIGTIASQEFEDNYELPLLWQFATEVLTSKEIKDTHNVESDSTNLTLNYKSAKLQGVDIPQTNTNIQTRGQQFDDINQPQITPPFIPSQPQRQLNRPLFPPDNNKGPSPRGRGSGRGGRQASRFRPSALGTELVALFARYGIF